MLDLVVVGAGLAGSEVVCQLAIHLGRWPAQRPIQVCLVDRCGDFAQGVAYGAMSPATALLIESIGISTSTEFCRWIAGLDRSDRKLEPGAASWLAQHRADIEAGAWDRLHCPRRLYGLYQRERFDDLCALAGGQGSLAVERIVNEVVDIAQGADGALSVSLASGQCLKATHALLAMGTIPRHPLSPFGAAEGYIENPYVGGLRSMEDALLLRDDVEVVIIGSNASAIEMIYHIESQPHLAGRVGSLTTVSPQGHLLPGSVSSDGTDCPADGVLFPSAPAYIERARKSVAEGRLRTLRGMVTEIRRSAEGRLQLRCTDGMAEWTCGADLVLNCAGAGRMETTSSPLLAELVRRWPDAVRSGGRGFRLQPGTCRLAHMPQIQVLGPLLNGDSPDTYVENIRTICRAAPAVAAAFLDDWRQDFPS